MPTDQRPHPSMTDDTASWRYAEESRRRRYAIPSEVIEDSLDADWTSVLLDRHRDLPDDEVFDVPATSDHVIVAMLRGGVTVHSCNAGRWSRAHYRAGIVGLTPPGKIDRLRRERTASGGVVEKATLYIPHRLFDGAADEYRRVGRPADAALPSILAFDDPVVTQTLRAMLRAITAGEPDLYAESAAQWLVMHLLSAHGKLQADGDARAPGTITDRRLERVVEYMTAHRGMRLTLATLAAEAGVSRFHFARLFRQQLGVSPNAYLAELRLTEAWRLLVSTELSVGGIATLTGFGSAGQFSTCYARRYGVTPTKSRALSKQSRS